MDNSKQNSSKNQTSSLKTAHKVELDHLHSMNVTGVVDVPTFTDKLVIAKLANETLQIVGQNLSVKTLDIESGRLQLNGQVNSLKYTATATPTSFMKRIFK